MIKTLKDYFPMKMDFAKRAVHFQRNYAIGNKGEQEKQLVTFITDRILLDKNPLKKGGIR